MRQFGKLIVAYSLVTCGFIMADSSALMAQPADPVAEPIQEPILEPGARPIERVVLTNFKYLSPAMDEMIPADFMLIEDGLITSIDNPEDQCATCDTIDLEGGYLIPGLMDLHQHLNVGGFLKESQQQKIALLRKNLYWGITAVYNPNIKRPLLRAVKAAVQKKPRNYPEFFAAGENIGFTGGWGDTHVSNFQQFRVAATQQLEAGADNIKISIDDMSWLSQTPMARFPEALLTRAVRLMHDNGRRVFVHATQTKDVEAALRAGVDGILHGTIDRGLKTSTVRAIADRKIGFISTLTMPETVYDVATTVKGMRRFDPDLVHGTILYDNMSSNIMATNWRDWWNKSHLLLNKLPILRGNTLALVRAGAIVGIGTDAGTPAVIFGSSLPYEMQLHEKIGLNPLQVIKMASYNNARILKIEGRTGSIREGLEADLVYMLADPSKGIKALNTMQWAMQNGAITYRQEIATGK